MLRKKVEHYSGYQITEDIISKINLMAMTRYGEGVYSVLYEGVDTLEQLCYWYGAVAEQEHVVLGQDWVIIYVKRKREVELVEWLDVEDVPDKFEQTMEMVQAMKEIFLDNAGLRFLADMRHDTSYQFYQKMLERGFFESHRDCLDVDPMAPRDIGNFAEDILNEYGSLEEYFAQRSDKVDLDIDKYFYHSVSFGVTDKFVKKYIK